MEKNIIVPSQNIKTDSFVSMLTKLNTYKDRKNSYVFQFDTRLSQATRQAMYKDSAVTKKAVNCLVDEALKRPIIIKNDKAEEINQELKNIKLHSYLKRTWKSARQNGTAVCFYHINDGNPTFTPVDYSKIRDIKPGFVLSKDYIYPYSASITNSLVPVPWVPFSEVEFYQINIQGQPSLWHVSRLLIFNGEYAGEENINDNSSFWESTIDLVRKAVLLYELVNDSVTTLSDNVIQEILKLDGLTDDLRLGNFSQVMEKLKAMLMAKSVVNKIVMDKEDEFQYNHANVSGYKEFEEIAKSYLAAVTGIPRTKLFGESPSASLGSTTGNYENGIWFDSVEIGQNEQLAPEFEKALKWVSPLVGIPENENIDYMFAPLEQVDALTRSQIRENQSKTAKNYVDAGIFTPEEVNEKLKEKDI